MPTVKNAKPKPGRRPTAADVAALSGVSRATVSYVLNNVPGQTIPARTRDRVQDAATALGYIPSAVAASLRRGHSRIILVVTEPALSGFVTEPFLAAITTQFTQDGYSVLTHDFVTDEALIAVIREIRPFGVLALSGLSADTETEIRDLAVPRVYSSSGGAIDFPRPWEEEIGRIQANFLIDHGANRILYASPTHDSPRSAIAKSRYKGVALGTQARGLGRAEHITLPPDRTAAARLLAAFFDGPQHLGICGFDDVVAATVLAAAHDCGVAVPGSVSVIGVDDVPFAALLTPPLTTVAIDGWATGVRVAERFLGPTAAADARDDSQIEASIVERASVARPFM
jgi:DNA-binding LacI/PurR family transcriptional regulator